MQTAPSSTSSPGALPSISVPLTGALSASTTGTILISPSGHDVVLPADFTVAEMELLHNYSTSTCYTLSRHPVLQTVWRIKVPQLGFTSNFVLNALLAVSALHLAYSKPTMREHYVSLALHHHQKGLLLANSILPNSNEDNCTALYLFAALTCIISCAKPRNHEDFLLIGRNGISEWMIFFRGTRSIITTYKEILQSGSLSPFFLIGSRKAHLRETGPERNQECLIELKQLVEETVNNEKIQQIYYEAIEELRKSFVIVSDFKSQGCESAEILIWLFEISDEYLALLSERSQESLAILAYFCVLLKQMEWTWYMEGWSSHLISGIWYLLDHEHRSWIQWPIEQIGWIPN